MSSARRCTFPDEATIPPRPEGTYRATPGTLTSTGVFSQMDLGNRQTLKANKTETAEIRRSKRIPNAKATEKY